LQPDEERGRKENGPDRDLGQSIAILGYAHQAPGSGVGVCFHFLNQ
jgi:hypothetical protein